MRREGKIGKILGDEGKMREAEGGSERKIRGEMSEIWSGKRER